MIFLQQYCVKRSLRVQKTRQNRRLTLVFKMAKMREIVTFKKDLQKSGKVEDVAFQLEVVKSKIKSAINDRPSYYGMQEVTLVAVSKRQSKEKIDSILHSGQRVFGENRVQEAVERWSEKRASYKDLKLHLIGPLQTNKAKEAVNLFDVIEVLDREKLAKVLAKEMSEQNRNLPCYIQVNTGEETQKSGVMPDLLEEFTDFCRYDIGLNVVGLMCIPPVYEEASMHFALLRTMSRRLKLSRLSMGMSNDYVEAIGFGATSIRVGSAIFGDREP